MSKNCFCGNIKTDSKLIGQIFKIKDDDKIIKSKFSNITIDGYYVFKVMDKESETEEIWFRAPKELEII